jgi:thymidylate synthase ThyX
MELYDVILREFEYAQLTYSLIVSAACFGQLKRHRIATLINQGYDPSLGYTVPVSVRDVGMIEEFSGVMEKTERLYKRIKKKFPGICDYILTNAHRKRVLMNVNLRELYHISRLREDPTAQWDIRDKVQKMSKLARKTMPITSQLLGGKSDYARMYHELFGFPPKVTEVPEPG